jgi:hypothetical protein
VKIYVQEPADATVDRELSMAGLKRALESALAARRSIRFEPVADEAAAEMAVAVEIREFLYAEHDPVDKLIGLGGTAWDAMHDERYARLSGTFTVSEAGTGRVLWSENLKATVTDARMTREESRTRILARAAEVFIREAYGRKKNQR